MRNLLALLALVVITLVGLGWYLDWYDIRSETVANGKRNVNIDIDSVKITQDVHSAVKKSEEKLQKFIDSARPEKDATPVAQKITPAPGK